MTATTLSAQTSDRTQNRLGGAAALLMGLLNIVIIIYVVAAGSAQRFDPAESIRYFAESPLALSVAWIVFTASAVLSYAVIPAVGDLLEGENRDWLRAATLYGLVGYTVLGVWAITLTRTAPGLAHSFVTGDAATRSAVLAMWLPEIDPDGWFSFGGPGTWLIVVNLLALRSRRLPRLHAWSGILLGIGHWATVFAAASQFEPLNLFASAVGAIFYPIWYIWLSLRLWRGSAA